MRIPTRYGLLFDKLSYKYALTFPHYITTFLGSRRQFRSSPQSSLNDKNLSIKGQCPWIGLGGYVTGDVATQSWRKLKTTEEEVASIIERHLEPRLSGHSELTRNDIDWDYWEKAIKHKAIVTCLKTAYYKHLEILDSVLKENHKEEKNVSTYDITLHKNRWNLFDSAIKSCEQSVTQSEELVTDGAKALWASYKNPPVWSINPEEWLDSDLYWQSYIEKHHHFDPAKDIQSYTFETFEDDKNQIIKQKELLKKLNLFHDRSDTPTLYSYMDQLHSSDYYDLYRRVFLEHMIYFLIRTGNNYHFFPEIPPIEWIIDIEAKRYTYLMNAHQRRITKQLSDLRRDVPMDLCPNDEHLDDSIGETYFYNLLVRERSNWDMIISRWMGDFIFLSYPAIPCQSTFAISRAIDIDHGRGQFYSLGDNIAAVFYVPSHHSRPFLNKTVNQSSLPSPKQLYHNWLTHIALTGKRLNPGYMELLSFHQDLLEKRGDYWFTAGNDESLPDAFLRRLSPEDPQKKVYQAYVNELKDRWNTSIPITVSEAFQITHSNELFTKQIDYVFSILRQSLYSDKTESNNLIQHALKIDNVTTTTVNSNDDIPPITYLNNSTHHPISGLSLANNLKEFESEKEMILELFSTSPLPR